MPTIPQSPGPRVAVQSRLLGGRRAPINVPIRAGQVGPGVPAAFSLAARQAGTGVRMLGDLAEIAGDAAFEVLVAFQTRDARLQELAKRKQVKQDHTTASKMAAEARSDATARLAEARVKAPLGAPGFTEAFVSDFEELKSGVMENAPETARDFLDLELTKMGAGLREQAFLFEIDQREVKQRVDFTQTIDLHANTLRRDDSQLPTLLVDTIAEIEEAELPAKVKANLIARTMGKLGVGTARGLIDRDPGRALEELKGSNFDLLLAPELKDRLIAAAEGRIAILAREARAAKVLVEKSIGGVVRVLRAGEFPPEADLAAAREAVRPYPDLVGALLRAEDLAGLSRTLHRMSPGAIQATLDRLGGKATKTPHELDAIKAVERELARAKAARGRVAGGIEDVLAVFKAGEVPPETELDAARQAAAQFPKLADALARAEALARLTRALRAAPAAAVQGAANELRAAETRTARDLETIAIMERVLARQRVELPRDALSYAVKAGVVKLAPFEATDPASMAKSALGAFELDPASIAARVKAAQVAELTYGVPALPFTDEDIADIARRYAGDNSVGRLAILSGIEGMDMPEAMRERVLDALNVKNPALGLMADLARRDLVTARRVINGREFMANNPDARPKPSDRGAVLDRVVGNALVADETGEARAALIAAADGFYVDGRKGRDLSVFDEDAYAQAIEAVAGEIIERNGQRTILPPGMGADAFEDRLEALDDVNIHPDVAAGTVDPALALGPHRLTEDGLEKIEAALIVEDGRLVTVGAGLYFVGFEIGGGLFTEGEIEFAVDGRGRPYVPDLLAPTPAPPAPPDIVGAK